LPDRRAISTSDRQKAGAEGNLQTCFVRGFPKIRRCRACSMDGPPLSCWPIGWPGGRCSGSTDLREPSNITLKMSGAFGLCVARCSILTPSHASPPKLTNLPSRHAQAERTGHLQSDPTRRGAGPVRWTVRRYRAGPSAGRVPEDPSNRNIGRPASRWASTIAADRPSNRPCTSLFDGRSAAIVLAHRLAGRPMFRFDGSSGTLERNFPKIRRTGTSAARPADGPAR
jgi:hypothetical protein